jgi:hypothetical protein
LLYFEIVYLHEEEKRGHFFKFLEKPNGKRDRVQSFGEDAKGDGEPSNAFLSEPM